MNKQLIKLFFSFSNKNSSIKIIAIKISFCSKYKSKCTDITVNTRRPKIPGKSYEDQRLYAEETKG